MKKIIFIILIKILTINIILTQDQTNDNIPKVTVNKLKITENYDRFYYGARIEPNLIFKQYSPIAGSITEIFVRAGDYVTKDQDILSITKKSSGGIIYNPTIVRALSNGIIINLNLFVGLEVLEKQELFTVAQISNYKVNILVSDKDLTFIKRGDIVNIRDNNNITGRISYINIIPDNKTGLFTVEITFPYNKDLFIGKYVEIEIKANHIKGILIPQNNVVRKYGKNYLYIVEKNIAYLREIKLGKVFGSNVIILEGVQENEEYVVSSNKTLNDGDKVFIIRENKNRKPKNRD